jgi:Flp pilus assembly protein TadB
MDKELIKKILLAGSVELVFMLAYSLASQTGKEKLAGKRVREVLGNGLGSLFDRGGDQEVKRMKPDLLASWKECLYWAQVGGQFTGWSAGGMLARGLIFGLVIFFTILLSSPPFYAWLLVPFFILMPYFFVKVKSDETKNEVKRLLPETVTVIAAEMNSGSTAGQAVSLAGGLPGPLGKVIKEGISKSELNKRALFSSRSTQGFLMDVLGSRNLPELSRFAIQLDMAAAKGKDGPRFMEEFAREMVRGYKSQIQQNASDIDSDLLLPMIVFFFLPFIMVILIPTLVSFANMI